MTEQLENEQPELLFSSDNKTSIIVVPSHICFVVPLPNKQRYKSESELAFDLESHVLIDAESLAFSIQTLRGQSLAIVTDSDKMAVHLSESKKTTIAICPKALLTIEGCLCGVTDVDSQKSGCFIVPSQDHVDVVLIDQGQVAQWRYCEAQSALDIAREMIRSHESLVVSKIVVLSNRTKDNTGASDSQLNHGLIEDEQFGVPVEFYDRSADDLLHEAAYEVLNGRRLPMVCLKSNRLTEVDAYRPAYRHAMLFIASISLLGALLVLGMYLRAGYYRAETEKLLAKQEAIFKRVFPKQKIPVGMLSRFQSEQRRLSLTKGTQSRPAVPNALEVLHALLEALPETPEDLRYQIQNVRVEQKSIASLVGRVESLEALDRFRQLLTQAGFTLPPVSSRPDSQGVPIQWTGVTWTKPKQAEPQNASSDQSLVELSP